MKRTLALLGATAAGFTSIVALHGPNGTSGSLLGAPATSSSPAASSGGSTSPATSSPAPSSGGSTPAGVSAVGRAENYGYGTMSVKVTVAQNHIVNVAVSSLTTLDSYSQQLEKYVVPILKAEVLKAQGIRINALTGATYTSEAYAYSIQSALDKLHFK